MGQELFQCWRYSSEQIDKSAEMGILRVKVRWIARGTKEKAMGVGRG